MLASLDESLFLYMFMRFTDSQANTYDHDAFHESLAHPAL
jgi:hypothetical protein